MQNQIHLVATQLAAGSFIVCKKPGVLYPGCTYDHYCTEMRLPFRPYVEKASLRLDVDWSGEAA